MTKRSRSRSRSRSNSRSRSRSNDDKDVLYEGQASEILYVDYFKESSYENIKYIYNQNEDTLYLFGHKKSIDDIMDKDVTQIMALKTKDIHKISLEKSRFKVNKPSYDLLIYVRRGPSNRYMEFTNVSINFVKFVAFIYCSGHKLCSEKWFRSLYDYKFEQLLPILKDERRGALSLNRDVIRKISEFL